MTEGYAPIRGGWQIRLRAESAYKDCAPDPPPIERIGQGHRAAGLIPDYGRLRPEDPIGRILTNPRNHRRPLYPPADKSLVCSEEELVQTERYPFRPLVLAYNAPRFLFDYHAAGGLLGHLRLGLTDARGGDKWFHAWADIDVRYVEGRCEYTLRDNAFGGVTVNLTAIALADAVGLQVRTEVTGASPGARLVWAYGGASAFFTNYDFGAPEFGFSPEQCAKNTYVISENTFELQRAFDDSDRVMQEWTFPREFLKTWQATVRGGCSTSGSLGFAAAETFEKAPGALLAAVEPDENDGPHSKAGCVVVGHAALSQGVIDTFVTVGMGNNIEAAIAHPNQAWRSAHARNASIAGRFVLRTPDAHLNAAATMMAFANDSLWASQAYVHGGWSWRQAYLGWRILYGPVCCGWTERVRQSIMRHCQLGRITEGPDRGGIGSMLENPSFGYNMNEVFIDMTRHYFDYTGDLVLMEDIFPVLEGMLDRENRRLRPTEVPLYENALNTWISDAHWSILGHCTQSSAYMLRAYEFVANIAGHLGKDPEPFREGAKAIRNALQETLWQTRKGTFAEYRDTRGNRLLHREPELPSLYHAAEFGAADALQVYLMLNWADGHLKQERTPGGGLQYWSSDWFPNHGRSYTHSTHEMAYAEELNFAEMNLFAGRGDVAYALIRSTFSGMFNGPTPGGLACHAFVDGTQRGNDEFADAESMWVRAVAEGLFGIRVDRLNRIVTLAPQLPEDWDGVSIETPHFAFTFKRSEGRIEIEWRSPVKTGVRLTLPLRATEVSSMNVNRRKSDFRLREGVGLTWLEAEAPSATEGNFSVAFVPETPFQPEPVMFTASEVADMAVPGVVIDKWLDPQCLLAEARVEGDRLVGRTQGAAGPGLLFVSEKRPDCPRWLPVRVSVAPREPMTRNVWKAPDTPSGILEPWIMFDLGGLYNAEVPNAPQKAADGAIAPEMSYSQVGFDYWRNHLTARMSPPCDEAWRAKIGVDGVAWAADGIPFKSPREGDNIAVVSLHNHAFPPKITFPAGARGTILYLMVSGVTHPNQSHVINLRVTLRYADGAEDARGLVNPFGIGDCWSTWCGTYFDTPANGFENIGGRNGPAGTCETRGESLPVAVDTIAHLVPFDLRLGVELASVTFEAIANDVAFGLMGASILKGESG